ncbi:KAP family P-loop NTPase fold protein [Corallococcus sp. bb12-1]|uniref:KAP family P-loop NTPase fold protein n=1 Tax=Corallococcus sp. bb12-1 TaxID=2996784 RepID=UPI003B63C4FC
MKRRKKTPGASQSPSVQDPTSSGLPPAHVDPPEPIEDKAQILIQEGIKRASISDTPASEDEIGFQPYVDAVAAFLLDERTQAPLTLSIEGEWGAGKSSFMTQLEQSLSRKHARRTVKFNAWRHDKDEALWASFAIEFARQIAPRGRIAQFWKRLLVVKRTFNLREGFPALIRLLAGVPLLAIVAVLLVRWLLNMDQPPEWLRWFTDASLALKTTVLALIGALSTSPLLKKLVEFVGNPLQLDLSKLVTAPDYQGRRPFLEQFHEDFRTVLDVYVGPEIDKAFVFIDDLDRCEVPRAAELIQALHLMIPDNTKLIFVLGMDRDIVAAGIAQRQSDILPLLTARALGGDRADAASPYRALEFGHAFLDRFIQIPFRIPRMEGASLQSFCESLMLDPILLEEKKKDGKRDTFFDFDWSLFEFGKPQPRTVMMIESADADSPTMRQVVALVAPALDFNPRRLKQFINALRLNAFLHGELGSFDVMPGQPESTRLNLVKLSKLVALELWWPRLLDDAERDPMLIRSLELNLRSPQSPGSTMGSSRATEWRSQDAPMRILSIGLDDGNELYGIDFRKLRRVAPLAKRAGIVANWRRRSSAPWRPTSRFPPKLFLQWTAHSHESEAKTNLKALYTAQKAYFGEKDRYEADFQKVGFDPAPRTDGIQLSLPDSRWVAGGRFIYWVELQGTAFYGYALGVYGSVTNVEYEIRSDGDWESRPRRIAPAAVDAPSYKPLIASHEGLYFRFKYPSTFKQALLHRRGEPPPEPTLLSQSFAGVPSPVSTMAATAYPSTPSTPIGGVAIESLLLASDKSAHLRVRVYDGLEWNRIREEARNPSPSSGKQVVNRAHRSGFFSSSGYVSGWAFTHAVIFKNKVVVEFELRCEVQAKTGYARVMRKIIDSVLTAREGHWSAAFFWRRA